MSLFAFTVNRRSALTGLLAGAAAPTLVQAALASVSAWWPQPDIIVASDGSGQFTSIQEAVQSIPKDNRERQIILVRNGVYDEVVRVDAAYVTLRGTSWLGTRLQSNRPADLPRDTLGQGVLNISATAHDFVLENMIVHNTVEAIGPHAFAIFGRADRTIIQNADVLSLGADTLSLWRGIKGAGRDAPDCRWRSLLSHRPAGDGFSRFCLPARLVLPVELGDHSGQSEHHRCLLA